MGWQSTVDAAVLADQMVLLGVATSALQDTQMSMGIPPNVPSIKSYSGTQLAAAGSPYTLHAFSGPSRIWQGSLSLASATDSSYAGGLQGIFAQVQLGSGTVLLVAELAVGAPSVATADHCDFEFNGLNVDSGDTLVVNVNGGTSLSDAFIRASVVVLASTP